MIEFKYTCKDGRPVTIEVDDMDYTANVFTPERESIGSIEFSLIEYDSDEYLNFQHAYLDKLKGKYLRQGIGRACLKRVIEVSGLTIVAENNDGLRKDDGSHLTGDAPAFVRRMREEGLIADNQSGGEEDW